MKKCLFLLSTVVCLSACQDKASETAVSKDVSAAKHAGVILANMKPAVRPGDDFNTYVNGQWIEDNEIPEDRSSTGVTLLLHEEATANVKTIIEESASGDFAEGSNEQKVGDLYGSYMNMAQRNKLGITPLNAEFAKINALENRKALAAYFAEANKYNVSLPFGVGQYADFKNPSTYMMYTWQGGLGLPDREYYFESDEKSVGIREAYVKHIETMLSLAGLEQASEKAAMIMALETRMAREHMKKEDTRDMKALYKKIALADLPEIMPTFAWSEYHTAADISNIDGLVVMQRDHMRALDSIIQNVSMDDWKIYLHWKVLDSYAAYLNEEIDLKNFDFYSKTLQGVEQPLPLWKRAVSVVNGNLGEVVGKIYVARHFPPEAKVQMLELVNNVLKAYEVSIKQLDWMGEETRLQALDKLSKFTPKIGYPDKWKDYSKLKIKADDLFGNIQRSALSVYEYQIARQSGPVDRSEWRMTPQRVNAYYSPPLNEIVFPAAILQPPFFDMNADDAVNYGSIGAVIGHEIGHGFDDKGSTFDGDGVLRNWWTDDDRAEFEKRTEKLVGQYSAFKPFDDLAVNGEFTLGENIGDLGGLSIALLAYEMSLDGKEPPVMDGFTGIQRLFIGYAQSWLSKTRDEAMRVRIKTDPHSPPQYRVNGIVRNVPEFYEAFDISENDALYLPPEERVKIW